MNTKDIDYSKGSKKAYELEPGEVFSIDEGKTWLKCRFIVDDPEPSSTAMIITTSEDQFKLDCYFYVLLPLLPSELAANQLAPTVHPIN